ncbi:MAG: hypothetical protein ABW042_00610 [Phenylobacterium sp.]
MSPEEPRTFTHLGEAASEGQAGEEGAGPRGPAVPLAMDKPGSQP